MPPPRTSARVERGLSALTLVSQIILYCSVYNGHVRLDTENSRVQLHLAGLLTGHIKNCYCRHDLLLLPLLSCGSLLRVLADASLALGNLVVLNGVLQHYDAALRARTAPQQAIS